VLQQTTVMKFKYLLNNSHYRYGKDDFIITSQYIRPGNDIFTTEVHTAVRNLYGVYNI